MGWYGRMDNPCNSVDMDLFYAATTIFIGNKQSAPFWDPLWLHGKKAKDIAPRSTFGYGANSVAFNFMRTLKTLAWSSNLTGNGEYSSSWHIMLNFFLGHPHEYEQVSLEGFGSSKSTFFLLGWLFGIGFG
jgi:hypothetical protein